MRVSTAMTGLERPAGCWGASFSPPAFKATVENPLRARASRFSAVVPALKCTAVGKHVSRRAQPRFVPGTLSARPGYAHVKPCRRAFAPPPQATTEAVAVTVAANVLWTLIGTVQLAAFARRFRSQPGVIAGDDLRDRGESPWVLRSVFLGLGGALWIQIGGSALGQATTLALPLGVQLVGLGLGGAALAMFASVHWHLGDSWNPTIGLNEKTKHALVTTGPYAILRHPLYGCVLLMGLFATLAQGMAFLGFAFGVAYGYTAVVRVPREEKMLAQEFGEEWREYTKRTGAIFPRLF